MEADTIEIQNVNNIIHRPTDIFIDPNKGLGEYLWKVLQEDNEKIAQVDSLTGQEETNAQFLSRCITLAQSLKKRGIKTNDIVAYCCSNNMDYSIVIVACVFLGVKFSAFDHTADKKELAHCIKMVEPKIFFCDNQSEILMQSALEEANVSSKIIVFTSSDNHISLQDFLLEFKSEDNFEINRDVKVKDTCCVLFTSGTSGLMKGAEVTHYGLLHGIFSGTRFVTNNITVMDFTTTSWISNVSLIFTSILKGFKRIVYGVFDKNTVIKVISDYKVYGSVLTHDLINVIMKNPECCNFDTSAVKLMSLGSMSFGDKTLNEVKKVFPKARIFNGYGMTEVGGPLFLVSNLIKDSSGYYSVGIPNPKFYYKVVDTDTEECVGPNKEGELRIKYEGIMNGYMKDPEKTAEAYDEDGFFQTKDLVYYDDNYNFFIVGRVKEIFRYKGKHILPSTIEDELLLHPDVIDVAIIPIPDENGEVPLACIKLRENAKIAEDDFVKYISERLPARYHLRGGVKFVQEIPRNSRGKLRRNHLKELVLKEIQK